MNKWMISTGVVFAYLACISFTPAYAETTDKVNFPKANRAAVIRENLPRENFSTTEKAKASPVRTMSRKERIARDFVVRDNNQQKIALRYPGTAKPVEDVPQWSIDSMQKLSDYGMLTPNELSQYLAKMDRITMAKLIIRAYHNNEDTTKPNHRAANQELGKLIEEYDTELRNLGYQGETYAKYAKVPYDKDFYFYGEVRLHSVNHTGDDPFDFKDRRVRARLYGRQPISKDWAINAMGEADRSVYNDRATGRLKLRRLYLSGKYKDWKVRAGRFGTFYGDGNIYDGQLDGVSMETDTKNSTRIEYGKLRNDYLGGAIIQKYRHNAYDLEAATYYFKGEYEDRYVADSVHNLILQLGYTYYLNDFALGVMYLQANRDDVSGKKNGIIVGAKYGNNNPDVLGSFEAFVKYYDQARTTYIAHTMTGLADYMHGYKGYGLGFYYTFAKGFVYGFEYYRLRERYTGKKGQTVWNQVSYYF